MTTRIADHIFLVALLVASAFVTSTTAQQVQDTSCLLAGFVPFTYKEIGIYPKENYTVDLYDNLGFSHMAAAVLAMEQFNSRDPAVVPELAGLDDCNVTFDMENSYFFDTGTLTHRSLRKLVRKVIETGMTPCAIAGPYNDLPAQLLSAFASSVEIPLVSHRSMNQRVNTEFFSPYSNQVYPDQLAMTEALVKVLNHTGRNNYTAILYSALDTASQLQEAMSNWLTSNNIDYRLYPFEYLHENSSLTIEKALGNLRKGGYRTILVLLEFPEVEVQLIADAAQKVGLNDGDDRFWIFAGGTDLNAFILPPVDLNENALSLLKGSAMIVPLEGFEVDPENDKFKMSWRSQNSTLLDKVNSFVTIFGDEPGSYNATPDYFKTFSPLTGAAFLYDAVMTIGMGACAAQRQNNISHLNGVRSVDFHGATGRVRLGSGLYGTGGRNSADTKFGVVNMFHEFAAIDKSQWWDLFSEDRDPLMCVETTVVIRVFQITILCPC